MPLCEHEDPSQCPNHGVKEIKMYTLQDAIRTFLGGWFEAPTKPFRTKREARDEGMRQLGYRQAQEHLRQILASSPEGVSLSKHEPHENAPVPTRMGDTLLWIAPEFEVKR